MCKHKDLDMASFKKRWAAIAALGLSITLGGCMGGYGIGGGYASDYYDGYGGYGPSIAYGSPYGGGWYNDFYYPGNGIYVFDRSGRRSRWNDGQRRYWQGERGGYRAGRHDLGNNDGRRWNRDRAGPRRPDRGPSAGQWQGRRNDAGAPPAVIGNGGVSGQPRATYRNGGDRGGNWGGNRGGGNRGGGRGGARSR
jgi:hypothetical protein